MIQVALFNSLPGKRYVEFDAVPLERPEDFHCRPAGALGFENAKIVAEELKRGEVSGWIAGYRWFRQAGCGNRNSSVGELAAQGQGT